MNHETEGLRGKIASVLHHYLIYNLDETIILGEGRIADQILQVCKEVGLKFVGADLKLPLIKNPDAQIEEIDV